MCLDLCCTVFFCYLVPCLLSWLCWPLCKLPLLKNQDPRKTRLSPGDITHVMSAIETQIYLGCMHVMSAIETQIYLGCMQEALDDVGFASRRLPTKLMD